MAKHLNMSARDLDEMDIDDVVFWMDNLKKLSDMELKAAKK